MNTLNVIKNIIIVLFGFSLTTLGVAHADEGSGHEHEKKLDIGVTAGAGMTGFSSDITNDYIDVGGTWEVRGIFGVTSPLAIEAAYRGSAQGMEWALVDATLMSHGAEGALRLNLGTLALQPYVVAGAGWTRYTLHSNDMEIDVLPDDDVFNVPAGAGVSFYAGPALIDIRGTYRFAFDDELLQEGSEIEEEDSLNSWSATARVGMTF